MSVLMSRTIADLKGEADILNEHIASALTFRGLV